MSRKDRLPDTVLVDGPGGRSVRVKGTCGPVPGWDCRSHDVSRDGPTASLLRQRGSDGLVRARGYRRVDRFFVVVLSGGLPAAVVLNAFPALAGQLLALSLTVPALVAVRVLGITVQVRGDVLVVDQGWRRWSVPAGAVVEVSVVTDELVVRTHRRKIVPLAFVGSQLTLLTGPRSVVRVAAAVQSWVTTHPSGERGR